MLSGPNHVDILVKETNMKVCLFKAHGMSCCYVFYYLLREPLKHFMQCDSFMENLILVAHAWCFVYSSPAVSFSICFRSSFHNFCLQENTRFLRASINYNTCISRLFRNFFFRLVSSPSKYFSENIWPRYYPFLLY